LSLPLLSSIAGLEIGKCPGGNIPEIYKNKNLDLVKKSQI